MIQGIISVIENELRCAMNFDLVDLSFPKEGYREFISTWIFEHKDTLCVVDPGPTKSLHHLFRELGGRIPQLCLLTHIHVDHAGGVGDLCRHFPQLQVYAAENAISHLCNPSKLYEGSVKTLGAEVMEMYGVITPVSEVNIIRTLPEGIRLISTPGHAVHHVSYIAGDLVFCGEALGVRYGDSYIRPATPPIFKYDPYVESIRKLSEINEGLFCFGHFGSQLVSPLVCQNARLQIDIWLSVVREGVAMNKSEEDIFSDLLLKDKLFSSFTALPEDIKKRERAFVANSIKGIQEYLRKQEKIS